MAYSYVHHTGDGSTRIFSVPFPFLSRSYIRVSVNQNPVDMASVEWLSDASLRLPEAPAAGDVITITRTTDRLHPVTDFHNGSTLTEEDLDNQTTQLLHIAQEVYDVPEGMKETADRITEVLAATLETAHADTEAQVDRATAEADRAKGEADRAYNEADRAKAEADRAQTAAENAEAIAGTATEITLGGVRLAPQAQAEAGTEDGAYAMTPLRVNQHLNAKFPDKFTAALAAQTSAEPVANKIPLADGDGKLASGWLPAATHEQPGAVKLTSTPSATDESAAITPKGAHDTVVVNLLSTRSTTGGWTITGLTVNRPLIVLMSRGASVTTYAQLHIHSGAADGTSPDPSRGFILGHTSGYQASNTFACVPTESTVTLKINYLVGGATLRAYQ